MENELMTMEGTGFVADLTSGVAAFCSLKGETTEEKAYLFNLTNAPEFRLGDMINTTLYITDVFVETVNCVNEETGEITKCPRIVLIDKDMNGYQCVSLGVFGSLKKLFNIYGTPHWDEPIPITIKQLTKGKNKMLSLSVNI